MTGRTYAPLLLLLVLSGAAAAQRGGPSPADSIRLFEQKWGAAIGARDTAAVAPLLHSDYVSTLADGSVIGRRETLAQVLVPDSSDPQAKVTSSDLSALQIHMFGPSAAVATGIDTERGVNKSGAYESRMRFTDMWVRWNGRWVCVASQYTSLAPTPR